MTVFTDSSTATCSCDSISDAISAFTMRVERRVDRLDDRLDAYADLFFLLLLLFLFWPLIETLLNNGLHLLALGLIRICEMIVGILKIFIRFIRPTDDRRE